MSNRYNPGVDLSNYFNTGPVVSGGYDYDYFADGGGPDARGHSSDIGKKPNHPTFSTGSKYSNSEHTGGSWSADGRVFVPSAEMYDDERRMRALVEYLRGSAEGGRVLMVPPIIAKPEKS